MFIKLMQPNDPAASSRQNSNSNSQGTFLSHDTVMDISSRLWVYRQSPEAEKPACGKRKKPRLPYGRWGGHTKKE
jgi:hypothetical protein